VENEKKDYARQYYLDHRKALSKVKKERYAKDAIYRKKAKKRSKEKWDESRKDFRRELPVLEEVEKIVDHRNVRIVFRDKETIKLYSVTILAKMVGVTTATVRIWHLKQVIPEATHCRNEEKGIKRWYSSCYIENIRKVYEVTSGSVERIAERFKEQFEQNPDYELDLDIEVTEDDKQKIKERMGI
jgi:hypothetical protein